MFWNVFNFSEIQNYLLCVLAFGIDYIVYYCIALIRHIKPLILAAARDETLIHLMHDPLLSVGFRTSEQLAFMHELQAKHRDFVMEDLEDF